MSSVNASSFDSESTFNQYKAVIILGIAAAVLGGLGVIIGFSRMAYKNSCITAVDEEYKKLSCGNNEI